MKLELDKNQILNTNVSFLLDFFRDEGHIKSAFKTDIPSLEHYKLLTYISYEFNNSVLIDAGTNDGISALCLAQNPTNKVLSYDIRDYNRYGLNGSLQHTPIDNKYPNITFIKKDINDETDEVLLSSSFIMLDISHNGSDELKFSNRLQEIKYNKFLMCDDVKTSLFPLQEWCNSLPWKQYDFTDVGHMHGSVIFNCNIKL